MLNNFLDSIFKDLMTDKKCVIDLREKKPEEIFVFLQALLAVRCKLNQSTGHKISSSKTKKKSKIA